jgi:hypothetical protein
MVEYIGHTSHMLVEMHIRLILKALTFSLLTHYQGLYTPATVFSVLITDVIL